jgi:uncharacterized pyridoxamine 5'-phosphate oxidase family protein
MLDSCRDRKNIVVTGQVIDQLTNKPIPNAEVVVLCWYMNGIEEASFKKQTITTDINGKYNTHFQEGHQIDVASKAKDYNPYRSYNELSDNKINIDLKLTKIESNPTLKTLFNNDNVQEAPFLRVRIYGDKNGKILDFNNVQTFGFDFKTLKITTDTTQADFWFKTEKKEGQPTIIMTNNNAGLIPITNNQVKSSILFEMNIAPTSGYKSTYKLQDNDEGFFILCRDRKTYGKIILEKSSIDVSTPDGKGSFFKEFGKNFSYLYQQNGTTNLTYSNPNIDLESFLVDSRVR